ncbi:MAG: hypothetical protein AMJ69_12945 [Gammaproteobacteria bacterium SG8_47]|jgi:hypothetical protein|nr:MAG: hypothetical protein AMJ69_12945 [Gammaproteobacteria bacterium SG8_47]
MQQLSFLEPPPQGKAPPVWTMLDEEQRAAVVRTLARMMAKTLAPTPGEHSDERAEQDHQ